MWRSRGIIWVNVEFCDKSSYIDCFVANVLNVCKSLVIAVADGSMNDTPSFKEHCDLSCRTTPAAPQLVYHCSCHAASSVAHRAGESFFFFC